MGMPTKMGGGIVGIIVLLAALFLPKLLGGSSQPAVDSTGETSGDAQRRARASSSRSSAGRRSTSRTYWETAYPQAFGSPYEPTETVFFSGCHRHQLRAGLVGSRPVLLPGRQARVLRPRLPDAAAEPVRGHGRPGGAVHRGPRVRPPRPEPHRGERTGAPGRKRPTRRRPTPTPSPSSCRPTASPARGPHDADAQGQLEPGEIDEALNAAAAVGDDRIQQQTQGRVDQESWTHGSSEQRVQWFRVGYETGDPRECDHVRGAVGDQPPIWR